MFSEFTHSLSWQAEGPHYLLALAIGYLLGSIPFGLLLTSLAGEGDIRAIGSGSIGATNVLRTGNRWAAAGTLVFDAAKGAIALLVARALYGELAGMAAALGAFLGHLFPMWLRFKGGKGVATALGIMLALYWPGAIAPAVAWILALAVSRISSLASLVAAIVGPIALYALGQDVYALFAVVLAALIFIAHRDNIGRLLRGVEPRVGGKTSAAQ
jgi:glycerol-3-phosphate acyltransferase PlsY